MLRPICKDIIFLNKKASKATLLDTYIAYDLLDTIKANSDRCIGMAANMIGFDVAIIVVAVGNSYMTMFNPKIISYGKEYDTFEGCLCHNGVKKCKRHMDIKVEYYDFDFKCHIENFSGRIAETIEHEIDHLNGILI